MSLAPFIQGENHENFTSFLSVNHYSPSTGIQHIQGERQFENCQLTGL